MPIPSSYVVPERTRCCNLCQHVQLINGKLNCRFNEPSMTAMIGKYGVDKTLDKLKLTEVEPFGQCDEFVLESYES